MKLLRCPASSPDLSLIENLQEILAKTVYDQETLLIKNIVIVKKISLNKLLDSICDLLLILLLICRLIVTIQNKEKCIKYRMKA